MRIYIDADGCPVVGLSVELAKKYKIGITLISNTSHILKEPYAEIVTVEKGRDRADFEIVARLNKGDILVTQDYGLAAMILPKTNYVLNQNGWLYDQNNIDTLLMTRHVSAKERRKGNRSKGPKKRTKEQDNDFKIALEKVIMEAKKLT